MADDAAEGPWRALSVVVSRGRAGLVGSALMAAGAAGVQEDWLPGEAPPPRQPWDTGPPAPLPDRAVVRAWFEDPDADTLLRVADTLQRTLVADPHARPPTWDDVPDVDWEAAWRASFSPVTIGPFVVAPPWDAPAGALVVEPGQGFGTGEHPTTRLALVALAGTVRPGDRVLDVGTGSGILAIAAHRLGATVRGIDIDPVAVRDARANAVHNGLDLPFDTTAVGDVEGQWDVVVANVHAEILVHLGADLLARTGRDLVLGGILADREHLVRDAFETTLTLVDRSVETDWVGLVYRRRDA